MNGQLCEGLYLRLEGMECPEQEGRMAFGLRKGGGGMGHLGLQRLLALPAAHRACVWALLFLAEETAAVPWQFGAQCGPLLPPTCPFSPIPRTHTHCPLHRLPHGSHPFLNRPRLFCLQVFAWVVPSTGTHHPRFSTWKMQDTVQLRGLPIWRPSRSLQAESVASSLEPHRPLHGYPSLYAVQYLPHWAVIGFPICAPTPQLTGNYLEAGISSALLCGLGTQHRARHQGEILNNVGPGFPGRRDDVVVLPVPCPSQAI